MRKNDLWKEYSGKDAAIDNLLDVMGFNPNRDYSTRKYKCPKCGKEELVVKELHPDTDMNCMVHKCLSCGYEKEI